MSSKIAILVAGVLAICCSLATPASAKNTMCRAHSADGTFNGACSFTPQRGGSFVIKALDQRYILPRISAIKVKVGKFGWAEIIAVMASGIESSFGDVQRSKSEPACWVGGDNWVCAY